MRIVAILNQSEVVGGEFFIAPCHVPELFESVEQMLDPVAQMVEIAGELMT